MAIAIGNYKVEIYEVASGEVTFKSYFSEAEFSPKGCGWIANYPYNNEEEGLYTLFDHHQ